MRKDRDGEEGLVLAPLGSGLRTRKRGWVDVSSVQRKTFVPQFKVDFQFSNGKVVLQHRAEDYRRMEMKCMPFHSFPLPVPLPTGHFLEVSVHLFKAYFLRVYRALGSVLAAF